MFPSWRQKIRAAQIAWQDGRTAEATALLRRESVREFLPAKRLSQEIVSQLVERADHKLAAGESSAGWNDLHLAEQLGVGQEMLANLRHQLAATGIEKTREFLQAGDTALAERQIAKLEQHHLGGDERRSWRKVVDLITRAKQSAYAGDYTQACHQLRQAESLLPDPHDPLRTELAARRDELSAEEVRFQSASAELHTALTAENWPTVLREAERLLKLAPEYKPALIARRRAWQAVGISEGKRGVGPQKQPAARRFVSTIAWPYPAATDTMTDLTEQADRWVAWIDEVGGFLVCLGSEVAIGQPTPESHVDIPVRADLSRRHATIRRDGEHYILQPIHECKVDGREITGPTLLSHGALVELGDSLRLRFTRPHSLSATAVLHVESKHKTEPAVDGIILMSESCVLGPGRHSHIRCTNWERDVVLFRNGQEVKFRSQDPVEWNNDPGHTSGIISANCRLVGDGFALSFEQL